MAIFKAGVTFCKAHHFDFGFSCYVLRGCIISHVANASCNVCASVLHLSDGPRPCDPLLYYWGIKSYPVKKLEYISHEIFGFLSWTNQDFMPKIFHTKPCFTNLFATVIFHGGFGSQAFPWPQGNLHEFPLQVEPSGDRFGQVHLGGWWRKTLTG